MATHYEALGVSHRASLAEIQRAHRQLAAQFHPDLHPGSRAAHEKFKAIQRAYDVLADQTRRRAYDEHLQRQLEAKADRWLARTIRRWRSSARRRHGHAGEWRPMHVAAAAIAACVLAGSLLAIAIGPAPAPDPLVADPSLVATDRAAGTAAPEQAAARRPVPRPLSAGAAAVEVSNPLPRDLYRPPPQP